MNILQGTMAALLISVAGTGAMAFGPLVDAGGDGDAAILATGAYSDAGMVRIVDIRAGEDFAAGHIPGAVNAPYGMWRGPSENPGRVPDEASLESLLGSIGTDPQDRVVIVHEGAGASDFGAAARVYWTLKSSGFQDLAILNGGYNAWTEAGGAPASGAAEVTPETVDITFDTTWWIDSDGVQAVVDGTSDAVLIDARPDAFFKGERKHDAAGSAGTLQGAINLVNFSWFGGVEDPVIAAKPDLIAQVKALAEEAGDAPLVSFCNTGHWAATNWFAVSELAGVEGVKLYPESMVGWTLLGKLGVKGTN